MQPNPLGMLQIRPTDYFFIQIVSLYTKSKSINNVLATKDFFTSTSFDTTL